MHDENDSTTAESTGDFSQSATASTTGGDATSSAGGEGAETESGAAADPAEQRTPRKRASRKRAARRPAGPPQADASDSGAPELSSEAGGTDTGGTDTGGTDTGGTDTGAETSATTAIDRQVDAAGTGITMADTADPERAETAQAETAQAEPAKSRPAKARPAKARRTKSSRTKARVADADTPPDATTAATADAAGGEGAPDAAATSGAVEPVVAAPPPAGGLLFQAPEFIAPEPAGAQQRDEPESEAELPEDDDQQAQSDDGDEDGPPRRRRRRGGRGRRKKSEGEASDADSGSDTEAAEQGAGGRASDDQDGLDAGAGDEDGQPGDDDGDEQGAGGGSRRRRRRKRKGDGDDDSRQDDPPNTVVKVREPREADDEVTKVTGSTRLEAKKQRRREGREAGRRRAPVISESEFLARREAVERVMAVRQTGERTQIAVLEDDVLVEHYVSRASDQPLIGNVYLGRVQNVLPAMEAAFVDIGRGRNAVLYAGEVDWAGLGHTDGQKRIEEVLKSGQSVLVQVTKEPAGHKGARLTSQISLPGRYVVYVPGGSMSGISRKLPDKERNRLKKILKQVVPDDAGVIVRTAAEGASEEELTHDVSRLRAQWEEIQSKRSGSAPQLLYGEPDLAIKVVRDLFNEDFSKLVVAGDDAWQTIEPYVSYVASSLQDRLEKWSSDEDIFSMYRVNEQIAKALDRKVWLPSGGSLVIDRTEAMTVIDVNTGKFTGSGGNLEETVTKNNLEAAEEIVRQLRLRDIGGIIVVDFIDMVLEANRDLVLRRLVECLGRDRTKHQVAEVTSLGLVQMTRKRIGTGLLEAFSESCEHCNGRGLHVHAEPVAGKKGSSPEPRSGRGSRRDRRRKSDRPGEAKADESDAADVPVLPKLEAKASPGEASPADLMSVDATRAAGESYGQRDVQESDRSEGRPEAAVAYEPVAAPGMAAEVADSATERIEPGRQGTEPTSEAAATEPPAEPVSEPPAGSATEPSAEPQPTEPAKGEPSKPARRTRRRAQRPAGSPDSAEQGQTSSDIVVAPV